MLYKKKNQCRKFCVIYISHCLIYQMVYVIDMLDYSSCTKENNESLLFFNKIYKIKPLNQYQKAFIKTSVVSFFLY